MRRILLSSLTLCSLACSAHDAKATLPPPPPPVLQGAPKAPPPPPRLTGSVPKAPAAGSMADALLAKKKRLDAERQAREAEEASKKQAAIEHIKQLRQEANAPGITLADKNKLYLEALNEQKKYDIPDQELGLFNKQPALKVEEYEKLSLEEQAKEINRIPADKRANIPLEIRQAAYKESLKYPELGFTPGTFALAIPAGSSKEMQQIDKKIDDLSSKLKELKKSMEREPSKEKDLQKEYARTQRQITALMSKLRGMEGR